MISSILTIAFLVCSPSLFADNEKDNGNVLKTDMAAFVQAHIDKLKADIELTAEQEKEIGRLLEQYYKDRKQSAKKADEREQVKSKKLDYEAYLAALNRILTEEQLVESERKAEERKNAINYETNNI